MLGTLDTTRREVTIVGAGIAGLLAADALDRAGYVVTLLEASDRAGGLIRTRQTEWGIAESAAHSLQATPAVLELCERLGIELLPVRQESRARYIWRRGKLRKFPLGWREAARAFIRAYFVLADRKIPADQITLEAWTRRHLGPAALKYLMVPFVRGIYGARPSEINVSMAFPRLSVPQGHSLLSYALRSALKRLFSRSPKAPRPRMMAPKGGMGSLSAALETSLRKRLGDRFKLGAGATELPDAPNVVVCVPAHAAGPLFDRVDARLADALRGVIYTPLVSVTAFIPHDGFTVAPQGVGVLLPEGTERKTLGVLFNSSSFSNRVIDETRWMSLTLMMGGSARPELAQASEEEIRGHVVSDLGKILDLRAGSRVETVIHRWTQAVPQYNETLRAAWNAARSGWCSMPGRVLFGNYTGQVSVRGMIETVSAWK